jgi:uncharacterized membrane protein YeaQ/YmgE (transglycosylase-associated protein family)
MIWCIIVGGFAGWLASMLYKGSGSGIILNVILGIIGGVVGGWVFNLFKIQIDSWIGPIITAVVGAFIVLFIYNTFFKKKA